MRNRKPFDFGLLIVILLLLAGGIIMISSASSVYAFQKFNNSYYFLIKQLSWAGLGIGLMLIVSRIDYKIWGKFSKLIFFISIALLILVLIPHIGVVNNGARRWIGLGFTEFQPSEVVKISAIIFFAHKLSRPKEELKSFWTGFIGFLIMPGIIVVLLMLEPHMSSAVLIMLVSLIMLFVAGARLRHFAIISLPGIAIGLAAIVYEPYRLKRLTTFLNPWGDPKGDGWQVIQSLYAIGSGGLFGLGLGRSRQKFLYIPEPHNDFIFSILAEELGYIGVIAILILFLIFIWRGLRIAMHAPDTFSSLLATGITSLVAIQVLINILVVTSSMPVTGMPLPFFSYGGSSLLFLLLGMGILLNISRHTTNNGS
jgi:cell division protein FtsW